MEFIKKAGRETTRVMERGGVPFLIFPKLEETGLVTHCFSMRPGGISRGIYASMNLSFSRGDDEACVRENYERLGKAAGFSCADLVCSDQTHTANVRAVTEADRGKGFTRSKD